VVEDGVAMLWPEIRRATLDIIGRAYGRVVTGKRSRRPDLELVVVRAAGRRGAAGRAAGPPGGWGPQARGERSEQDPPAEARLW